MIPALSFHPLTSAHWLDFEKLFGPSAAFAYMGLASAFRKAGFKEVARNSETRPIFRYMIGG